MSATAPFFLFLLFFLVVSSVLALELVQTSYQIQSANLLGRDLTVANFNLSFNEDFFVTLPTFCLAPAACPEFGLSPEDSCDYSRCGNETLSSTSCHFGDYCNSAEYPWKRLSQSEPLKGIEVEVYKYQIVRFYFNVSSPCSGFRIKMTKIYGFPIIGIKRGSYVQSQDAVSWDRTDRTIFFGECPGNYNFGYGTYFLGIWSTTIAAKLDLEVEVFEINMANQKKVVPDTATRCPGALGYAICPQYGIPFSSSLNAGAAKLLRIPIPNCTQFMIHHEISSPPGTLAMLFQMDTLPNTASFSVPVPKHPFVMTICPSSYSSFPSTSNQSSVPNSFLWVVLATEVIDLRFVFYISNDPSEWSSQLIPVQELGSFAGREYIDGMVHISCLGQKFLCFSGADSFGSCQQAWNPMPRKDGNVLWPIPRGLADSLTDKIFYEDPPNEDVLVGNEVRASLLLESYYKAQSIVPFPQWETELEQCILSFQSFSLLSTKDGQIPLGNVSILGKKEEFFCSLSEFQKISETMNQYGPQFDSAKTIEEIVTLRYSTDILTFEKSWQGCSQYIESLLVVDEEIYLFPKSTTCSVDMMKNASLLSWDACCNETMQWTTCCQEREIQTMRTSYKIQSKHDLVNNTTNQNNRQDHSHTLSERSSSSSAIRDVWEICQNPDCVNALLENYIFYQELIDSSSGCGAVVSETLESHQHTSMEFYRTCKSNIFGEDQKGRSCLSNTECLAIGSEECDIFRGKCLFNTDQQRENRTKIFFQCLVDHMPTVIRNELSSQFGNNSTKNNTDLKPTLNDELISILTQNFTIDDCDDDFGRSVHSTGYSLLTTLGSQNCGPTDWFCSDTTCDVPMYLEMKRQYGRLGSLCARTQYRKDSREEQCSDFKVCNWNNSIVSDYLTSSNQIQENVESCQNPPANGNNSSDPGFCGYCTSSTFCVIIEGLSQTDCEARGKACFNGYNGFNLEITDDDLCENQWGLCSVNCSISSDGLPTNVCTRERCEAAGRCSDQDVIQFERTFHSVPPTSNISNEERETELNGLCLSPMVPWNQVDCNRYTATVTASWQPIVVQDFPYDTFCVRNKNRTECLNSTLVENDGFWWYPAATNRDECEGLMSCQEARVYTQLKTLKNVEECDSCGANYNSTFTWTQGEWVAGQMIPIGWIQSSYEKPYSWSKGVDFDNLSQFFLDALSRQFALQLVTELECRVNPTRAAMESILCVCDNGLDRCESGSLETVSLGLGELCLNTPLSLVAPPATVTFDRNSLVISDPTSAECIKITVLKLDQGEADSSTESSISLTFRKRETNSENVWNSNDATVGKTIGDGVELKFTSDVSELPFVDLCLMAAGLGSYSSEKGKQIDFGVRIGTRVQALGANVTVDRDLVCLKNMTITQTQRAFFPIIRDTNSENVQTKSYSAGQLTVYSVMFILYFTLFTILMFHNFVWGTSVSKHTGFFNVAYSLALLVRWMYFLGLLIAQPTGSETVAEFLAAEFPTIAYLSAVSGAAMLWAVVKVARMRDVVHQIGMIANVFLCSFFIVFAVLFFELQVNGSYSCYGLIYSKPDRSDQDILRIVYYSVLCFCSLVLGFVTLYFSGSLMKMFFGTSGSGTNPRIKKWLIVTLVCSLSVVCQCIFALVYTLDISPSYQYALVLILTEILPACPIIQLVLSVEVKSNSGSRTSSAPKAATLPDLNTK